MARAIVKIQRGPPHHARIHIPQEVCEALGLQQGDLVEIDVRKVPSQEKKDLPHK